MSWRTLLSSYEEQLEWRAPATEQAITATEDALKVHLPFDLRSFLAESNGLFDKAAELDLVWSVEFIASENLSLRSDPLFADVRATLVTLLFFSWPLVDGILLGLPISETGVNQADVIAWYPIENRQISKASSLEDFLSHWLNGSLTF